MTDKEKDDMVKAYVDNMPDMVLNSNGIMNWRIFFDEVAKKVAGAAYKDGINAAQKQMIDKACKWLQENLDSYLCCHEAHGNEDSYMFFIHANVYKDFRKYLEE